jgi:hypothetical protein
VNIIISQPRYLPALSYVNRLCCADLFIVFDIVQRQPREPHNRNRLLCNGQPKWITIPIAASNRAMISEMKVAGNEWIQQHKDTINSYYFHAPYYNKDFVDLYFRGIDDLLTASDYDFTACIVQTFLNLGELLDFKPNVLKASEINDELIEHSTGPEKLNAICKKMGAGSYISGPAGREYGVEDAFRGSGVEVLFHSYDHPVYAQSKSPAFVPYMGFFDALFNLGKEPLTGLVRTQMTLIS